MEYAYAVLLLSETGEELNEQNLRAVLEAANCSVSESRVKALVAALEGVEVGSVDGGTVASVVDDEVPGGGDDPGTDTGTGPGESDPGRQDEEVTAATDRESSGEAGDPVGEEPDAGAGGDESG